MHYATRVRKWRVAPPYSGIALPRKLFGIEHLYRSNILLTLTDIVTSQNIDLSYWVKFVPVLN
jgi:hypothetical protein